MRKIILSLSIIFAFFFSGCVQSSPKTAESSSLASWQGEFKSVNSVLKSPNLYESYQGISDLYKGKYSHIAVQNAVVEYLGSGDIENVKIHGNFITYSIYENGNLVDKTYEYEAHDFNPDSKLIKLKATKKPDIGYLEYVSITKIHQDAGSQMYHFHMKYSDAGFDALQKQETYPTFTPINTPRDVMIAHYKVSIKNIDKYLPKSLLKKYQ